MIIIITNHAKIQLHIGVPESSVSANKRTRPRAIPSSAFSLLFPASAAESLLLTAKNISNYKVHSQTFVHIFFL